MRTSVQRGLAAAAATILAIAAAPAIQTSAAAGPTGDDANVRSDNMSWVANVAYPEHYDDPNDVDEQGGTDLEVGSLTVLDADGAPEVRDYAFAGTYQNGFQIVDVTDPESPVLASTYVCDVRQGDIQVMTRPDMVNAQGLARTFVTYAIDGSAGSVSTSPCYTDLPSTVNGKLAAQQKGGGGSIIIEVTDPAAPRSVAFVPASGSTHNGTIQAFDTDGDEQTDSWLFYNSENDAGGNLEIWDLTDPIAPKVVKKLTLAGSGTDTHDVTFSADTTRAYVASITNTYILDTTDPRNPTMVSRIADPGNGIHHQADPITVTTAAGERDFVIISDEIAGAAGNGYCPGGGLHVWDVTVEQAPVKVGAYFMPDIKVQEGAGTGAGGLVTCTSHVFRMYADQMIMTIANMAGGVRVIDLSNLVGVSVGTENMSTGSVAGLRDLGWFRFNGSGEAGHDTWAVKAHADRFEEDGSFYMFSNDQTRGFEVFRYDATDEAVAAEGQQAERGSWATPAEAVARWQSLEFGEDALLYSCRFPTNLRGQLDV